MCSVKKPKVQQQVNPEKPPVYLTNPFLDDPGNRAVAFGRNALRIDPRGSTANAPIRFDPIRFDPIKPVPQPPTVNPGLGIGGDGSSGGIGGGTGYAPERPNQRYRPPRQLM